MDNAVDSLHKLQGVVGILIIDDEGNTLSSTLASSIDASLYESMTIALSGSSRELLKYTLQGELEKILIESEKGKIIISRCDDLNLVVISEDQVNLGLLNVEIRRAVRRVRGKEVEIPELVTPKEISPAKAPVKAPPVRPHEEEIPAPPLPEIPELVTLKEAPPAKAPVKAPPVRPKREEIPIPPLPEIPEKIEIPDNPVERARLMLDIYNTLLMSISISASRISGIAPTRGLFKKFLPGGDFPLLSEVEIKKDVTLDVEKLRSNMEKIPPEERGEYLKENFSTIMNRIVDGYVDVMGYKPLRGMMRKEVRRVMEGYGNAMEELGIKETIPQQLIDIAS